MWDILILINKNEILIVQLYRVGTSLLAAISYIYYNIISKLVITSHLNCIDIAYRGFRYNDTSLLNIFLKFWAS